MLASLTRASLVDAGTDQGNNNARRSLSQWSPKDWDDLEQILEAVVQQTDVFGNSNNGETSKRFTRCIDRVKRIIKTNVVVSALLIRKRHDGKQNARISWEASCNATLIVEKDPHIKKLLSKLLTKNHQDQITGGFRFKEDQELRQIIAKEDEFPFALEKFPSFVRRIFNKLTRDYTIQRFSRYVSDDKEKITEKNGKDQDGRMSEQPPQKWLKASTQEAEGQKHASHDKRPREESQTRIMSSKQTPQKRLKTNTQESAKPWGNSQTKPYKGRRPWTDEEKNALRVGVDAKGVGSWAIIKDYQQDILKWRTSGQIKDCYRTMKRKGEIE